MTTPQLELNIKASGVEEVKALKAALAELNGAVGQLQQYKNISALDQLSQELKGLRSDMQSAMRDIKQIVTEGIKGTFQQAQQSASQGSQDLNKALQKAASDAGKAGEQIGNSLASGLEKGSVRVRVAAQSIDLSNGLRLNVSGNGITSADKVKQLASELAQSAPALEAAGQKVQDASLAYRIKLMVGNEAITRAQNEAAEKEAASAFGYKLKMMAGAEAIARAQEEAALRYAAAVARADAVYQAATARSQLKQVFTARSLLDAGQSAEQVSQKFGTLAVNAAQGAASAESLLAQLASTPLRAKAAQESVKNLSTEVHFGSSAFREAGTLLGEVMGGNFSRMRQSSFALANQMGILKNAFTVTGLAVSGILAVVGLFVTAIIQAEKEVSGFKNAMTLTGGYMGVTKGQFDELAKSASEAANVGIGKAKEALLDMAKTGKFTGDSVGVLSKDILLMSEITGESLSKVVADYAKMPDGVHKWAVEHNDSMHFMSAAQLEHIRLLELQGQKQQAMIEVGNLLNEHLKKQTQNLGYLEAGWKKVKEAASAAWDAVLSVGREDTIEDKLKKLRGELATAKAIAEHPEIQARGGVTRDIRSVEVLQEEIRMLEKQKTLIEDVTTAKARSAETQQLGQEADKILDQMNVRISKAGKERQAVEQATAAIKAHNKAWLEAGNDAKQQYNTLTGQGFITDAEQARMLQLVHEKFNGGRGAGTDGSSALLREQWKNDEQALKDHFTKEQALYTEQYRNKLLDEGTYIAKSEANTTTYRKALIDSYLKSLADMTAQEKAQESKLPLNLGADARTKKIESLRNQLQVAADNGWAKLQKDLSDADTAFNTLSDNAVGAMLKATKANDEYWNKAEKGAKKEADLAATRRALAGATEEERARAEAVIKVEDTHAAYMDKLQEEYQLAVVALQSYMASVQASGTFNEDQLKTYLALARAAQGYSDAIAYARSEIEKLKDVKADAAVDELANKKIQELRDNAKSLAKTTATSIVDALLTGGKAGVQKLKDAVKQAFLSPIKIILQAVVQPIANGLVNMGYSLLGMGNATSTGGGVNLLQMASNTYGQYNAASSLYSIGSQYLGGTMSGANAAGTLYANATGSGIDGLLATNGAYGTAATAGIGAGITGAGISSTAAGGVTFGVVDSTVAAGVGSATAGAAGIGGAITSGLAAIGPVGWIALAAIAAYAIFGGKGGGPKDESAFNYASANTPSGALTNTGPAKSVADAINAGYSTLAQQLGLSNSALGAGAFISKDPQGKAQTQLDVTAPGYSRGSLYGTTENVGRSDSEFQAAVAQATEQALISGLKNSDLDQKFKDYLSGVDLKSSAEVLAQRISDVLDSKRILDVFAKLSPAFDNLKNASIETIKGILEASGGFDVLSSKLNSFYSTYYTDTEKQQMLQQSLSEQFAKLNLAMPTTRDEFKKLVLAQDLTTTTGVTTFNALLNLSDAFAQLTQSAANLTSATQVQATLDQKVTDARSTLQTAYNSEADRLTQLKDRMQGFATQMDAFLKELTIGDLAGLTPQQQYAAAKAEFEKYAQELNSSDPTVRDDALTNLQAAGKALLDASRTMFGASNGYYTDLAQVTGVIQDAKTISQAGVDVAKLQLTALDSLVTNMVELRSTTNTDLNALYNVSGSGFAAIVSAISTLRDAQLAAGQGPAPDATTTITGWYQQYANRSPDPAGLAYWKGLFDQGMSPDDILLRFKASVSAVLGVPLRAGLDRVPYDNFPATLHKDETVLNAAESDKRRRQLADQDAVIQELRNEIAALKKTVAEGLDNVVAAQFQSTDAAAEKTVQGHKETVEKSGWAKNVREGAKLK